MTESTLTINNLEQGQTCATPQQQSGARATGATPQKGVHGTRYVASFAGSKPRSQLQHRLYDPPVLCKRATWHQTQARSTLLQQQAIEQLQPKQTPFNQS
jgi:hypothetical protein